MKKIYNSPSIDIEEISPSDIITASENNLDFAESGSGDQISW